ncbi:MAG: hypothetical protein HOA52_04920 [Flavobacteriales bacterium]|nr:hypothetical protein [Flavobacteriales bacterium]
MRIYLQIFILTIVLFSCKTSYDKSYTIQCNNEKIQNDINTLNEKRKNHIDSIYHKYIEINTIDILTDFIKTYPESEYIDDIKDKRQILFQNKAQVENSQFDINELLKKNPCYIPIYKNIDYLRNKSILFNELINSEISELNPYKYRFLVGDLNTLDENGKSRGVKESFMKIEDSWEFIELFDFSEEYNISYDSLLNLDSKVFSILQKEKKEKLQSQLRLLKNYHSRVGRYLEDEIEKNYSSYGGYRYTGQKLCFCEVNNDTILLIAEHVTSARGKTRHQISEDSITGIKKFAYSEAFPIGDQRKYYAAQNKISIKNWETQRKYNSDDKFRDSLLGGGNSRVTFFDGKSQLPNFMLIDPDPLYPRAMKMNGIHEGSLSNMSRCMLGTPQSLGCFRTTDYGSKFSRWWTPRYANLFIYYDEDRYTNKELPEEEMTGIKLPFKSKSEGNKFRKWVNNNYPSFAKKIDLEEEGSCSNCFIQQAWELYYHEYIKTNNGKKLNFSPPEVIIKDEKVEVVEKKNVEDLTNKTEDKNTLSQYDIIKEYFIIIGCFKEIKNANSYSLKIEKKGYSTSVFYDKNAKCNFVAIGGFDKKQQALSELPNIQQKIDKESWIYTKVK